MNAFYEVINGLYSNDMLKVIHTLNKYSLCHVEEVDGINQEAIHTGFYFLTRNGIWLNNISEADDKLSAFNNDDTFLIINEISVV